MLRGDLSQELVCLMVMLSAVIAQRMRQTLEPASARDRAANNEHELWSELKLLDVKHSPCKVFPALSDGKLVLSPGYITGMHR